MNGCGVDRVAIRAVHAPSVGEGLQGTTGTRQLWQPAEVCVCGVCAGAQDIKHTEHVCPWGRELVYSPLRRAHVAGPTIGQGTRAPAVAARVSTHIVPTAWECWVALVAKRTAVQLGVGRRGGEKGIVEAGWIQDTLSRHTLPFNSPA